MANTENIEAKLCAYIDGDLDAAGRAEIEKHLAANPQHRGLIEQLSRQRDLLRQLPRENAPDEILDALQSQMERSVLLGDADAAAEAEAMKIHRWPQLMAAAAIVVLTVGLGAVIYFVLPRHAGTGGNYARVTEPGATTPDAARAATGAALTESTAADRLGTAREDRAAGALGKSAGGLAASSTDPAAVGESAPSIAMAPGSPRDPAGEKFKEMTSKAPAAAAPSVPGAEVAAGAGAGVGAAAGQDPFARDRAVGPTAVLDAQYRLHGADLARQLKDTPGGLQDNAMFVVVSTADPSAARSEVTDYLASNKIAWEAVTHPTPELAPIDNQTVSLSRAQGLNVQMKQGPLDAAQQQQVERPAAAAAREKKSEAESGIAGGAGAPASSDAAKAGEGPARREQVGVANAGQEIGRQPELMSNSVAIDPALEQATTQGQQQQQQHQQQPQQPPLVQQQQQPLAQQQQPVPARVGGSGRLIIARGMTKQQAAELSSNLSKQTTVQRAAVYEQRPLPGERTKSFFDGTGPATRAITTTSPFNVPPELASGPATNPAAAGDAALNDQTAVAAPTTQEAQTQTESPAPTTTTAPAPTPIPLAENGLTVAAAPATQPAGGLGAEERIDVVILVEDDVPPATLAEPNAAPPSVAPMPAEPQNAAPTTVPATQDSAADRPAL